MFFVVCGFIGLVSGVVMANEDQWHGLSSDKNPHAQGGCASKDKVAQFHKFHPKKEKQVNTPNSAAVESKKRAKTPSLDQYI